MVSTKNASKGLFERREREPENNCLHKRLFPDYTFGLDKIYTREEIALVQQSPSFERDTTSNIYERLVTDFIF